MEYKSKYSKYRKEGGNFHVNRSAICPMYDSNNKLYVKCCGGCYPKHEGCFSFEYLNCKLYLEEEKKW